MRRYRPFAELPARRVLTRYERSVLEEARSIIEGARTVEDADELGRAEAALSDILTDYREDR